MAKSKYVTTGIPEYRICNGKPMYKTGKDGRRTLAEKKALIYPQAERIIRKFGGARELARVLADMCDDPKDRYNPSSIYRWMYPVDVGGTGGEIPAKAMKLVMRAARYAGILLTPEDLYPKL